VELKEFLQAVVNSWIEKVGIVLTILPFIEKIPRVQEWLKDKPLLERFVPLLWVIGGLCIIWGFYSAWLDQRHAWIDEREARLKLESVRPYLVIEELSPAEVRAWMVANVGNRVRPEADYSRAYLFGSAPNNEFVLLTVRNLPNSIPAHNLKHYVTLVIRKDNGETQQVPLDVPNNQNEVLMPGQYITRQQVIPKGTMFTGINAADGAVRIKLTVTFTSSRDINTTYFYQVALVARQHRNIEDMNRAAMGGLKTESTNEGVVANLDDLLKP
jgi:hypothetical protein